MNKTEIKVPIGTQFISDWKDYKLPKNEHCIVDKGITGCGYTEFCLMNLDNVILCSPRKLLLENKRDQHINDHNILYLENTITDYSQIQVLENTISQHIFNCQFHNASIKFMVTYDSLHYISNYLCRNNIVNNFIFVVDEFQAIFLDSYFKSTVEIDFVEALQFCPNVIYLSATPYLEKYLERLDEFKNLSFYKLDWSETGYTETVKIMRRKTASLTEECGKIVQDYLNGDYPMMLNSNNKVIKSTEAVFYFNSVTDILRVIRKHGLTPQNTSILCSKTPDNKNKLKKCGFSFSKVPLKGQINPMFTFCTSAVYIGVDFYSTCAKSYVFADPNIESLALDISLDLPQIIGRQRDKSNSFKNDILVFYKTKRKGEKDLTSSEFRKLQEEKRLSSKNLLEGFQNLTPIQQADYLGKFNRDSELYVHDYISVSKNTNRPVYNHLIEVADERAWEVSQKDYQDSLTVTKAIQEAGFIDIQYKTKNDLIVDEFLNNHFFRTGIFTDKMRMYCEFCDKYCDNPEIMASLDHKIDDPKYKGYYNFFGTSGCSRCKFQEGIMIDSWNNSTLDDRLEAVIKTNFKVGDRYSMKDIKIIIQNIYQQLGITRTAKAKDLDEFFELSKTKVTMPDKTIKDGFKIINIK